jgi:molecular chaperone DnaK (HSP70)
VERIVGIDLGTTNSLIAFIDDDTPRVIPDAQTGDPLLPSVVAFLSDGQIEVGQNAKALLVDQPLTTIQSVKRFMGLGMEHVSAEDRRRYRFADEAGIVRFALPSHPYTAPEVSAFILRALRDRAEASLKEPCS